MSDQSGLTVKIGLFGIGLDTYWPQFHGLKERLEGYQVTPEIDDEYVGG